MSNRTGRPRKQNISIPKLRFIGEPTEGREEKSAGFEREDMGGGMVRSRYKAILTPAAARQEMISIAIKEMRAKGIFDVAEADIRLKQTAVDRLLLPVEHEAICWFIDVHAKVESGKVRITDYLGSPRASEFNRAPFGPIEQRARMIHAFVTKHLPEAHLEFLDWLAWHENPGMRDGCPPNKIQVGKVLISSGDARRAEGGLEGFLRAVAQNISHWRMEADTILRRRQELARISFDHRRKNFVG